MATGDKFTDHQLRVHVRPSWKAPWVLVPYLQPLVAELAVGPRVSLFFVIFLSALIFSCEQQNSAFDKDELKKENLVLTEGSESDIIDLDYCFRLRSPGRQWKLMHEKDISGAAPDALAGAVHSNGTFGAIIVEACGNAGVRDYVELLRGNWRDMGLNATSPQPVEFLGQRAMRCNVHGLIKGITFSSESLVFIYHKHGYQLLTWGVEGKFNPDHSQEFRQAFSLTNGKVRARGRTSPIKDYLGVGQRVIGGRFESAMSGIAANSNKYWTVMIGAELEQSNEDAEFGMKNTSENLYLVVIPESVAGLDKATYRHHIISTNELALSGTGKLDKLPGTVRIPVGGQPVTFNRYLLSAGLKMKMFMAVHFHADRAYQIMGWGLNGEMGEIQEGLAEGFGQLEFLSPFQVQRLTREMLDHPDTENEVGPDWSLRRGNYRDFAHGMTWTKPQGFWRLSTGDEAKAQNADCRIFGYEARTDLYLQVIPESADDWTLESYHDAVTRNMFSGTTKAYDFTLDRQRALVSAGKIESEELTLVSRIATTIRNNMAFQIMIWGTPVSMKEFAGEVDEAIRGFRFPGSTLRPTIRSGSSHTDHRMGYTMRLPGTNWRIKDITPRHLKPIGSGIEFTDRRRSVFAIAMTALEPGQDEDVLVKTLINNSLKINFSRATKTKPTQQKTFFSNLNWTQQTFTSGNESLDFLTSVRDRTIYLLGVRDGTGQGSALLQQTKAGFQLID